MKINKKSSRRKAPAVLPVNFYSRPTLKVARDLLGKILCRRLGGTWLSGRIVEVEAYHQREPSAHSYGGPTKRNRSMFAGGGRLYVYRIYGIHHCLNVVTETEGVGAAVLIRAIEPTAGEELIEGNRAGVAPGNWTNGPGKICQALAVDLELDGADLFGNEIRLLDGPAVPAARVRRSSRIGISKATELQWRFYETGNPHVSGSPR